MKELGGAAPMRGRPRSTDELPLRLRAAGRRGAASSTWWTAWSRRRPATSATSTSPRSRAACRPTTPPPSPTSSRKLADMDGIALLAPDMPPVKLAVNELVRAGVHVVTLFSDVAGLDARDLHRRRQPRRRPHRRPAARARRAGAARAIARCCRRPRATPPRSTAASASRRCWRSASPAPGCCAWTTCPNPKTRPTAARARRSTRRPPAAG